MKRKHIFILLFSTILFCAHAQDQSSAKDTASAKTRAYQPNFMLGVDALSFGSSFFSDRKVYQGFISSQIKKNVHAIASVGFEKNTYTKNNYNATATGPYLKLGGFYMLAHDKTDQYSGFYAGGNLAGSFYQQEFLKIPIRGYQGGDYGQAFPKSSQSSFWIEANIGSRVQLFDSPFYIDVYAQPKYLLYTTKQEGIYPMIVPGFGKSSSKFNMGFSWNIAYRF